MILIHKTRVLFMIAQGIKLKALDLRRGGKSYNEISKTLHLHKSTLAYWFKSIEWSQDVKEQLEKKAREASSIRLSHLMKLRKVEWEKTYEDARNEAVKEFAALKSNPLFVAGVMLYWGEGDKVFKNGNTRIGNTDPEMLRLYNNFLQGVCNLDVERIRAWILVYPDNNTQECLNFWSDRINLPLERFYKPISIKGRHKTRRLHWGICTLSVGSKRFKAKMLKWIELFKNEF